jgi:hypothetical protein
LIIRYFTSRQKSQEYSWHQIDNWVFQSSLSSGRQAYSVPISKENKAIDITAETYIIVLSVMFFSDSRKIFVVDYL